jgi:hypothetical protein
MDELYLLNIKDPITGEVILRCYTDLERQNLVNSGVPFTILREINMSKIYLSNNKDPITEEISLRCYTGSEIKNLVNSGVYLTSFREANTIQEINACVQLNQKAIAERIIEENDYKHSTCMISTQKIANHIYEYSKTVPNIFFSSFNVDINLGPVIETRLFGKIYRHNYTKFKDELKKFLEEKENFNGTIILKIADSFSERKHIYSLFVEVMDNEIIEFNIVDTGTTPIDTNIYVKTISKILELPYEESFSINFLFNTSNFFQYGMGLQKGEEELNIKGYCYAWMFYFIYNFIRIEKNQNIFLDSQENLEYIYSYLFSKKEVITALIIHWWDNIIIEDTTAENWEQIQSINVAIPPYPQDQELY